jgi:predicted O-methyltransferase YrrM
MYEKPISVLEIGTWYGLGSTQVFKRYLPDGSSLLMLDKWSSYASEEDIKSERSWYRQMDAQSKEALLSVLEITNKSKDENQNIQKKGGGVNFSIIRSDATIFTNFLKSSIFDLVFIDGSHYYENVKSDIQAAKRLVKKDFSIICGDDLELKPNASNIAIAKEYIRHDSHPDGFHPGVLLAVSEEFEKVNIYEGFWFVYCIDGQFKTEK